LGQCYIDGFLPFTLATLTELCSFWMVERSVYPAQVLTKLSLTIKTDDATSGGRDMDLHGPFRGEWVIESLVSPTISQVT